MRDTSNRIKLKEIESGTSISRKYGNKFCWYRLLCILYEHERNAVMAKKKEEQTNFNRPQISTITYYKVVK